MSRAETKRFPFHAERRPHEVRAIDPRSCCSHD